MAVEPDVTQWPWHIPESGIYYRQAVNPEEPAVRAFESGPEDFAKKLTEFVQVGMWAMKNVRHYQFATAEGTVGFACVGFFREKHPDESSSERALYLRVVAFGLNVSFQRRRDDDSTGRGRFSDLVMSALEALARDGADMPDGSVEAAVGLSLWVLDDNEHAQEFYERYGFRVDTSEGAETLQANKGVRVMRMVF